MNDKLFIILLVGILSLSILNCVLIIKYHGKHSSEGMAMLETKRSNPICSGYGFKVNKTMPRNDDSSLFN